MLKRPIVIITISYILGIIGGLYLKNIALFLCVLFFVIILIFLKRKIIKYIGKIVICFIVFIVSFQYVISMQHKYNNLYKNVETVKLVGVIESDCEESEYYYKYIVKVKQLNKNNKYNNTKLFLKVKKNLNIDLEYGNIIMCEGTFEFPEVSRNYGGYDYKKYLNSKKIYGICEANAVNIIQQNGKNIFETEMHKLQNNSKKNLKKYLGDENSRVAIAFLLGDSSYLEDEEKNMYSKANLSHILAISGMHVTYFMYICNCILNKTSRRFQLICTSMLLIIFMIFTGNSISVARAVIMSCLFLISKLLYRKSDVLNNLSISALILIIINPYNIYNLSFQLSFLGTLRNYYI